MEGDSGQLFGATKGAVMAFTASLALTLAPEVRVNCLAPGWIKTAWGEHASADLAGARPPRDAAGPLGHARGRRPRRPLARFARGGVHHRADHPRQRRRRARVTDPCYPCNPWLMALISRRVGARRSTGGTGNGRGRQDRPPAHRRPPRDRPKK